MQNLCAVDEMFVPSSLVVQIFLFLVQKREILK